MRRTSPIPRAARGLIRSERGIAVPMVMLLTVAILALAGSAIVATINSQRTTERDQDTKLATAAADAGVQAAIERQNKGDRLTSDASPCVVVQGGGLVAAAKAADGWCPVQPATGSASVGTASYRYRLLPPDSIDDPPIQKQIEVVSVGTSDGVSRRVSVTALAPTGEPLFPFGFAALSDEPMTVTDQTILNALLEPGVSTGSNEDIVLRDPSGLETAELCADTQVGFGHEFIVNPSPGPDTQCFNPPFTWASSQGFLPLSPADQRDVATTNDNGRLGLGGGDAVLAVGVGSPPYDWNSATRVLELSGTTVLTLGGSDYSLCRLELSGASTLIVPRAAATRIWFDDPVACGLAPGEPQMRVTGASSIVSAGLIPIDPDTLLDPPNIAFLFLGSDVQDNPIEIQPDGGLEHQFVIWAPRSEVTVGDDGLSAGVFTGAVAAKKLTFKGRTTFNLDPHAANLSTSLIPIYHRSRYVQCAGGAFPATGAPNQKC
jgi:hypothetical protein